MDNRAKQAGWMNGLVAAAMLLGLSACGGAGPKELLVGQWQGSSELMRFEANGVVHIFDVTPPEGRPWSIRNGLLTFDDSGGETGTSFYVNDGTLVLNAWLKVSGGSDAAGVYEWRTRMVDGTYVAERTHRLELHTGQTALFTINGAQRTLGSYKVEADGAIRLRIEGEEQRMLMTDGVALAVRGRDILKRVK